MKNIIITILVAVVLVFAFLFFTEKKSDISYEPWPETEPATVKPTTNNYPVQNNSVPVNSTPTNTNNQSQILWSKSEQAQLYYPPGFIVEEHYTNYPGQNNSDPEANAALEFRATRGNAVISWGGFNYSCTENEYGNFVYGVSQIACLDGVRTQLGVLNVRDALTQEDINSFGDFVLKNQ